MSGFDFLGEKYVVGAASFNVIYLGVNFADAMRQAFELLLQAQVEPPAGDYVIVVIRDVMVEGGDPVSGLHASASDIRTHRFSGQSGIPVPKNGFIFLSVVYHAALIDVLGKQAALHDLADTLCHEPRHAVRGHEGHDAEDLASEREVFVRLNEVDPLPAKAQHFFLEILDAGYIDGPGAEPTKMVRQVVDRILRKRRAILRQGPKSNARSP